MHLENAVFLERLAELFDARKEKGSVFLTQKRMTYESDNTSSRPDGDAEMQEAGGEDEAATTAAASESRTREASTSKHGDAGSTREWPLLVRATDGRGKKDTKVKISTIVEPADHSTFTDGLTAILRSNLSSGLRPKRKRAGASKKSKAKPSTAATGAGAGAGAGTARGEGADDPATTTGDRKKAHFAFVPRLPKVVGPRRGNGRKKRTDAVARREKAVQRLKKAKEDRARRNGELV
ncbi:hypothetical protein JCM10212_000468 [Sporobolomyces blumeae]